MLGQQEKQSQPQQSAIHGFMGIGNMLFQSLQSVQSTAVQGKAKAFLDLRDELLRGVRNLVSKTDPKTNIGLSAWLEQNATAYPGAILKKLHSEYAAAKTEDKKYSINPTKKAGDWTTYCAHLEAIIETYPPQAILEVAEDLISAWSKLHAESNSNAEALKDAQAKVESLQADNQALRDDVKSKVAEAKTQTALAEQNERIHKELKTEVERLKLLADRSAALEQEVAGLRKQLDATDVQMVRLEEEKAGYKAKAEANAHMETELAVTKALLEQAKQRIAELEREKAEDRKDNKEAQAQMLSRLESLAERAKLDATANPYASTSMSNSFSGGENVFGGRPTGPVPRDLNASGVSNGNRGKPSYFAVPAAVPLLKQLALPKSITETTEPNAGKIATTLANLRKTRMVSELRINMFELLARFISYFDPEHHDADECVVAIDAYKRLFHEPLDPKAALDRLVEDLSAAHCSQQGLDQFEALKKDVSQLTRTTPRAVQGVVSETLNHVFVIAEIKNLTLPTRFNIPSLNEHFTPIYEEAAQAAKSLKSKGAVVSKVAPKVEEAQKVEAPRSGTDEVFGGFSTDNASEGPSLFG